MNKKNWVFASVFGVGLAVDQLTKFWVVNTIATSCTRSSPPGCVDEITIIPGFFSFVHAQNHGAAFSALEGQWAIFMVFTVIATIVVLDLVRRLRPDAVMIAGVLGMILSGALGNGIDRVRSRLPGSPGLGSPLPAPGSEAAGEHYVTDFLRVFTESPGMREWFVDNFGTNTWPIFNVADSVLLLGVACSWCTTSSSRKGIPTMSSMSSTGLRRSADGLRHTGPGWLVVLEARPSGGGMEREEMPCDVLFVGAGPANLAGAIHLMGRIEAHNEAVAAGTTQGETFDEPMIMVIEKGSEVGAHQLSGAVLDPRALTELIPDWKSRDDFPVERYIEREEMVFLTEEGVIRAPWIPPELINHGKPVVALGKLCKWLAEIAEEKGVQILPEFAGVDLLWEGDACVGVRTGDKGIGPDGKPKDIFEPGYDLRAPVTILGEGPRGHLARKLIQRRQLDANSNPMAYELGCKEILELPPGTVKEGFVTHTLGFPLDLNAFGGSFIYTMGGDKVCIGLLVALDHADPDLDVHHELQVLKTHPYVRDLIGEGKVVKYGAKTVTIGGWASIPQLYTDGAMIVGDSASFLNPMRVKGIHLSMKSGMLAAEAAFDAMVSGDASEATLKAYKTRLDASWVKTEMEPAKNMHHNFREGFVGGLVRTGLQYFFGPGTDIKPFTEDYGHMKTIEAYAENPRPTRELTFDGTYLVDKLTDVFHSGTKHEEQQPAHLKILDTEICATICKEEYGNPCVKFCPAQVYTMVDSDESGRAEMQVDFSNCVHCKTCDIRDPYQIITWLPPEGGNGPEYGMM